MEDKIKVIVDTDPGVDDCIALMFFMFDERIDLKLVTTVSGNRPLNINSRNCMHLFEKFGKTDVPIALGASKPLKRPRKDASFIHAKTGMGTYQPKDPKIIKPLKEDAVEAMYKVIMENKNEIVFCEIAPQTNLASLLTKHPDCAQYIKQIVFEGGSPYCYKGRKPHISFNASSDPEAMSIVLDSGIPIVMLPSEMGRCYTYISEKEVYKIRDLNETGQFVYQMFDAYWEPGYKDKRIAMNDSCVYFYVTDPKMFKGKRTNIDLDLDEYPGKMIMDFNKHGKFNLMLTAKKKKSFQKLYNLVNSLSGYHFTD